MALRLDWYSNIGIPNRFCLTYTVTACLRQTNIMGPYLYSSGAAGKGRRKKASGPTAT